MVGSSAFYTFHRVPDEVSCDCGPVSVPASASVPEAVGKVFVLVEDELVTSRDYVNKYIDYTEANGRVVSVPYFLRFLTTAAYDVAARAGMVTKGITSLSGLRSKQASVRYGNGKAKRVLGWKPRIILEQGMEKTFNWYISRFRR